MASKRQLKKRISYVCGDLASDVLLASHIFDGISRDKVRELVTEIASMQEDTRRKVTFSFDKTAKDFENRAEYNKARAQYFAKAFAQLRQEFTDRATAVVKQMNEAIPAEIREAITGK